MNLARAIAQLARARPTQPALTFRGATLTYAALWHRTVALMHALRARGVAPGQRVGVALGDHPAHVMSFFALAGLGAVLVPVDKRWSPSERHAALSTFDVSLLLVDEDDDSDGPYPVMSLPADGVAPELEFQTIDLTEYDDAP
ncbi:MAG: class I adenylate-forming enzyme family protein, partial [Pseudomonadota bacterium]